MKGTRSQKGIITTVVLLLLVSLLACQLGRAKPTPEVIVVTPTPVSALPTQPPEAPTQPPEAPTPSSLPGLAAGPVIDDFEGGDFEARWWADVSEGIPSFTCASDPSGHDSAQAMRLTFEVGAEGYAGCGMSLDPGQWANVGGLSFSWRSDRPDLAVSVGVGVEDPTQTNPDAGGVTPFQAELLTPGEEWTPVTLTWDDLAKPEWVGEGGVDTLDPAHIVALNFYVGNGQSGSVWVDDLQLLVEPSAAGVAAATPTAAPPTAPETVPPTVTPTPMPVAPPPAEGLPLNPNPPASTLKLIFIHHSTGGNWLADPSGNELGGDLGRALMDNNYFVSATNYGWEAAGDAIGDRTDIGNWWEWFRADNSANVLAALYAENGQNFGDFGSWPRLAAEPPGENQVIMFKSCFPNSNLQGGPNDPVPSIGDNPLRGLDAWSEYHTVANAKGIYNDLLAYFATRQDKLFIVIAAPPLLDPAFADNARAFNIWLTQRWLAENGYSYRNVAVWDFYNVLTGPDNHHRYRDGAIEYITNRGGNTTSYPSEDEHPSRAGNQKATAEFVPWLNVIVHCWQGDGGCP